MFRVCAWCERFLGVSHPYAAADLTHGICADCVERIERDELRTLWRTLIIVRPSQRDLRDWLEARYVDTAKADIQVDRRSEERRMGAGPCEELDRRQRPRRRPWSPAQAAAWRALGVVVIRVVPKPLEAKYPGLEHVHLSNSIGTPRAIMLEQLAWLGKEVLPEFARR